MQPKPSSMMPVTPGKVDAPYEAVYGDVSKIIDAARESAARSVNAAMTAAYWLIGRRIVEFEQSGEDRAEYGAALVEKLAEDLTGRFGRGFSQSRASTKCASSTSHSRPTRILPTPSGKSAPLLRLQDSPDTVSGEFEDHLGRQDGTSTTYSTAFPLPWSAYVRLLVGQERATPASSMRTEALRGGWSVRQLDRQIRLPVLRAHRPLEEQGRDVDQAESGSPRPKDLVRPEEEIKDPFVLEFLDLKDEYSESDLEDSLDPPPGDLPAWSWEDDFCFMGRQRRLRIGNRWYRVDLLFYHRGLRCLVVIDLKIGAFTHADAGQMHLYLNYAREHWVREGENPPVGLILCSEKDEALARYALEGLPNNVMAGEYRITLPGEEILAAELGRTRQAMELRSALSGDGQEE